MSVRSFEFDIGWAWIRLFQALGLANVRSTGPVVARVDGKADIDKDTAWALLNDRFSVMARYSKEVVRPVIAQELARADQATRKLIKRARRVLCRDDAVLDPRRKDRIEAVVAESPQIRLIYDLQLQLRAIWAKRGGNMDEIIHELAEWCRQAEESGMHALRDFAETLKSYATPAAARA